MTTQKLPQQIDYVPDNRAAIAPYNFVPLPEKVVSAEQQEPVDQSVYHADRYTGRIECTLTTASPLYVRCGYTPEEYAELAEKSFDKLTDEEKRKRAQFFNLGDPNQPVIPGSSLRGMLRALVEIAGYGKMDRVMSRQLFYRSVGDQNYQRLFVEDCGQVRHTPHPLAPCYRTKIRAGFLRVRDGAYVIEEVDFARIDHDPNPRGIAVIPRINGAPIFLGHGPGRKPNWVYQNQPIHVVVDSVEVDYFFQEQYRANGRLRHPNLYLRFRAVKQASFVAGQVANAQEATLVITGPMQNKHMEFVFLHNVTAIHSIDLSLVKRFEDDDQITQWQEGAFPRNQPTQGARRDDGLLRDGEPVFFLTDNNGQAVRFFGRAQLFRLPYGSAPFDFVSMKISHGHVDKNQPPVTDIAEAIFGHVSRNSKDDPRKPIAGRIFVEDGLFVGAKDGVWLDEITPKILATPKPTTFQHYLVQTSETKADQHKLMRYDSSPEKTTIRGHKLYWHKGDVNEAKIRESDEQKMQNAPKQYTKFKPVKSGTTFTFTIHFENLSDMELGALLWVLRLCDDSYTADKNGPYRFKLGMGKPLGMGAVKIESKVVLSKREERYAKLFADDTNNWHTGENDMPPQERDKHTAAFEQYVLEQSGEKAERLADTLRMRCLLALLKWPGPTSEQTRYMEIERDVRHPDGVRPGRENNGKVNEYSNRLVLPTPLQITSVPAYNQTQRGRIETTTSTHRETRSNKPTLPQVGEVKTWRVLERDEKRVALEVPGFSPKHVLGILLIESDTPKWTPNKDTARVVIIGTHQEGDRTIVDVKRAPNMSKPRAKKEK